MSFFYKIPDYKKVRVIIDTDAACEADDPYAIAHALMCQKFIVKGILAEHFDCEGSTRRSYDEICTILDAMNLSVPVFMGAETKLADNTMAELSPASDFLVKEALREEDKPLYVLCIGAITNVAAAIQACPDITSRMTVVWIGGQSYDGPVADDREYNAGNDVDAINLVLDSGVDFWQIPRDVYSSMRISLAEIQTRIAPHGRIGRHLFENMVAYNQSEHAGWTAGESWTLGDSPAVGVVLDPDCGKYRMAEAPIVNPDTTYRFEKGRHKIRVYTSIDSRFILEDLIARLELLF